MQVQTPEIHREKDGSCHFRNQVEFSPTRINTPDGNAFAAIEFSRIAPPPAVPATLPPATDRLRDVLWPPKPLHVTIAGVYGTYLGVVLEAPAPLSLGVAATVYTFLQHVRHDGRTRRPAPQPKAEPLDTPKLTLPDIPIVTTCQHAGREKLLASTIYTGYAEHSVTGRQVLEWLESQTAGKFPICMDASGRVRVAPSADTTVRTDTSLYQMYRESADTFMPYPYPFPPEYQDIYRAREFAAIARRLTRSIPLELKPAEPVISGDQQIGDGTWLDAECSMISISPARLLRQFLAATREPGAMWDTLKPALNAYIDEMNAQAQRVMGDWDHLRIGPLMTGDFTERPAAQVAAIAASQEILLEAELRSLLGITAIAMTQLQLEDYRTTQEALLKAMKNNTHAYPHMHEAIDLHDIAITAMNTHANHERDPFAFNPSDLAKFVSKAASLTDGTADRFRHIYLDMRRTFPGLDLPDEPAFQHLPVGYAA